MAALFKLGAAQPETVSKCLHDSRGLQLLNGDEVRLTSFSTGVFLLESDMCSLSIASPNLSEARTIINGLTSAIITDLSVSHQRGHAPCDGEKTRVWYCSNCSNGPMGVWYSACSECGHHRCGDCTVEEH